MDEINRLKRDVSLLSNRVEEMEKIITNKKIVLPNDSLLEKYLKDDDIKGHIQKINEKSSIIVDSEGIKFTFGEMNIEKFTEDEKAILRHLPEQYKYIARDKDNVLEIYTEKPYKNYEWWISEKGCVFHIVIYEHIFKSIQWEDAEPCEFRKYI